MHADGRQTHTAVYLFLESGRALHTRALLYLIQLIIALALLGQILFI